MTAGTQSPGNREDQQAVKKNNGQKGFSMIRFSAGFVSALLQTMILTATALAMILIWSYLRLPEGNVLIVVFAILTAVRIADISPLKTRLKILAGMIFSAAVLQFAVCSTVNLQILNILIPAAICWCILREQTAASAYPCR